MVLSVREALACIGHGSGSSVLGDLFGYGVVPKSLSLGDQLRLLEDRHYHVNVILVAPEDYPANSAHRICYALQFARDVYAKVGIGIGRVDWYTISKAQAGGYAVIDDDGEADDLTDDWTVRNDGLDLFIVPVLKDASGWTPVDGSCDNDSKGMTGSVVAGFDGDDDYVGNSVAHEMGHYLGLRHVPDSGNFIGGNGDSNSWSGIFGWQGDIMKRHCFMKPGCG
jgi:hypothetical protein